MGQDRLKLAKEKRRMAAVIRQYGAWLETLDKADLLAYAASIEAEADRLERGEAETEAPETPTSRKAGGNSPGGG